jgi:hypothetical protein
VSSQHKRRPSFASRAVAFDGYPRGGASCPAVPGDPMAALQDSGSRQTGGGSWRESASRIEGHVPQESFNTTAGRPGRVEDGSNPGDERGRPSSMNGRGGSYNAPWRDSTFSGHARHKVGGLLLGTVGDPSLSRAVLVSTCLSKSGAARGRGLCRLEPAIGQFRETRRDCRDGNVGDSASVLVIGPARHPFRGLMKGRP